VLIQRRFKIVALTAFAAVAVIGFTSSQTVINAGHSICQALGDGEMPASAIQNFGHRTHLTGTQATGFVAAAVQTYCGQFAGRLPVS
jgi:hypothetical protein